jgi:hypothetical protein
MRQDRELSYYGGHGVARQLTTMHSTPWVFWSPNSNSYVAVPTTAGDPRGPFRIVSINGIGEIRWIVEEWNRDADSNAAREYFGVGLTEGPIGLQCEHGSTGPCIECNVCEHGYAQGCRACDPDSRV